MSKQDSLFTSEQMRGSGQLDMVALINQSDQIKKQYNMKSFKFKREFTRSYSRNGLYKTIGVYIGTTYAERTDGSTNGRAVSITGLTSRNLPATGDLNIPVEEIDNFIELLQTFKP